MSLTLSIAIVLVTDFYAGIVRVFQSLWQCKNNFQGCMGVSSRCVLNIEDYSGWTAF